jgi:hypothetical protein
VGTSVTHLEPVQLYWTAQIRSIGAADLEIFIVFLFLLSYCVSNECNFWLKLGQWPKMSSQLRFFLTRFLSSMIVYDGDERLLVSLVSVREGPLMETWSPKLVENVVPDHSG